LFQILGGIRRRHPAKPYISHQTRVSAGGTQ
jgi:hypothetical protein